MEVRIEKLVYGGDGLAHHDGNTVFVPLVLPGELVRIECHQPRKKKFIRGRLEQRRGSRRRSAWQPRARTLDAAEAASTSTCRTTRKFAIKREILRETLGRIGRIQWDGAIDTHASPPFGYRNRAQWKLRPQSGGLGSRIAAGAGIGYFEMGSTRLCAVTECSILSPRLAGNAFPAAPAGFRRPSALRISMRSKPLPIPTMKKFF